MPLAKEAKINVFRAAQNLDFETLHLFLISADCVFLESAVYYILRYFIQGSTTQYSINLFALVHLVH